MATEALSHGAEGQFQIENLKFQMNAKQNLRDRLRRH